MIIALILSVLTISIMIFLIIKYPKIKFKKFEIQTFWIAPLVCALIIVAFRLLEFDEVKNGLISKNTIDPFKIIVLFFSMTFMSIVLDELNFFEYLANVVIKKACQNQIKLFEILYIIISILTMFTSNDIVILTFTPFIIFFAKSAKINPIPYLVTEFVAANTWSMVFIIGNPTNIYLATYNNVTFIDYFLVMLLPTVLGGLTSFTILFLLFHKELKKPLEVEAETIEIKDKFLLVMNLICLIGCTLMLIISSYIKIEMYIISFWFAILLLIFIIIRCIFQSNSQVIKESFKRIPWSLAPFVISMFIIVLLLEKQGITSSLSSYLGNDHSILKYGGISTLTCNFINNIPMSVLFSKIIPSGNLKAMYATIIGSNIGTFLTPLGALAGIMWMSILKNHEIKFSYLDFIKYGVVVAIPTLLITLLGLYIVL